jgi:FlhB-like protein
MVQKSIGLKYDADRDQAPRIIVKGEGSIAEKINQLAEELNVPLYKDEILAEVLYKFKLNYEVPDYLYNVIAEIYVFTYNLLKDETRNPV